MPDSDSTDRMTVFLEATGEYISSGIQSYRINSSYMIPTDEWEFVVYDDDDPAGLRRKFQPLQPVTLFINDKPQVLGRIDGIESSGDNGTALRVHGRDYLADLVDSTVDPTFEFRQSDDLGSALLRLFAPFGIKTVFGSNNLTRSVLTGKRGYNGESKRSMKFVTLSEFKAEENQGVFELANKIVARQGFMILPAGSRDAVVVDEPNYLQAPSCKLHRPGNVERATCSRNYANVPTVTIARGRAGDSNAGLGNTRGEIPTFSDGAPSAISKIPEVQRIITSDDGVLVIREARFDPKAGDATIYGFDPPVYKPLFYRDRDSKTADQAERGLRKMLAERLKDTLKYTATMQGHVDPNTDAIYTVDTTAEVLDGIEDVNEVLWMAERTLSNDGNSGPISECVLYRPDSYVL